MNKQVLDMQNIIKSYIVGEEEQIVLRGIDLKVNKGEFISVLGPSGSRKVDTYEYNWVFRRAYLWKICLIWK